MMLPLDLVMVAAEAMKQEAVRNKRRRPGTRVKLLLAADALPKRWVGDMLLRRAAEEQKP